MKQTVGVKTNNFQALTYYDNNKIKLKENITVIVDTKQGEQFGVVKKIMPYNQKEKLPKVVRIANKKDYKKYLKNSKVKNK